MAERTLELRLIAEDRMTKVFVKAERQLVSFGNKATAVGKKMTKLGKSMTLKLTTPILGLGVATLKVAGDFEFGMKKVAALTGATGDEFEALEKQAKELGRTTMFSARQVSEAMGFMAMAGFETNEILGATPKLLQLAAAGNIDLARAADITTNILTGYGLEVEQLGAANDVLAKTFTSTNTDLLQLGEAFKFVGPIAAGMEIPFQDTAAAIGLLGNAGIQASMAGTTLRGTLARITQAVTPAGEALNSTGEQITKLGLNFFTSEGKVKTFTNIIKELEEKGVSAAKIMQIFGLRAGPGMVALVSQGSAAMEELVTKLDEAGGTAQKIADKQMEGLRGQMLKLKSAMEGLAIAIADSGLLEFATNLAQRLTELTTRLAESNPRLLMMGTIILGIVATIGPVLIALGFMAQGIGALSVATTFLSGIILTKLIPSLAGLAGKLGLVKVASDGASLSMTTLGKAFSLVAAFAAGWKIGTILTQKFEVVRKFGIALAGGMLKIWEFIKIGAEVIWVSIKHVFEAGFNFLLKLISSKVSSLAQNLQKAFELTGIDALETAADALFDMYDKIDDSITETISLQDKLIAATENNVKRIAEIEEIAVELWNEVPEKVEEVGKETGQKFLTGVEEGAEAELPNASDIISDQANQLGDTFKTDFSGFDVGSIMMDDMALSIQESGPGLAQAVGVALAPVKDVFETFGSELKATEITLPIERLNAAVAGIVRTVGGGVGGVGGPALSAQILSTIQAAALASLSGFQHGGIATKPTAGVFGEAGPEALVPLDQAGGFGKTIINNNTITFTGPMMGNNNEAREFSQWILDFIEDEQARRS